MVVHFIVYVLFIEEYIGIIFAPDVSSGMELSVDKRVRSQGVRKYRTVKDIRKYFLM